MVAAHTTGVQGEDGLGRFFGGTRLLLYNYVHNMMSWMTWKVHRDVNIN